MWLAKSVYAAWRKTIAAASSSVEILERNGAWRSLPESDKTLTALHIVELAERCTRMKMR